MKTYLQKNSKQFYSNHWSTPIHIYSRFTLTHHDPCLLGSYIDPLTFYIDKPMFINPPYERNVIDLFIDMAIRNHMLYNKEIVLLIPSRTDTKYFHKLLDYGVDIEFIKGRLKFGNSKKSAPFPSLLITIKGDLN